MSDLLSILSQAARSSTAHRSAAATAAHNIQNANTPGYARQRAELHTVVPSAYVTGAFIGRGVELGGIYQVRDRFIESQMPRALAAEARSSTEAEALRSLNALNPEASGGLVEAMSGFYAAARALSGNAGDPILRQGLVDAATTLATAFNRTSLAIRDARTAMDDKVAALASQVDAAARTIARLNVEIQTARASGAEPNDLLDQRQRAIDELARLTGAVPVPDAKGMVSMVLEGGTTLVSGDRAARFTTSPDVANGGRLQVQIVKTDGNGPFPLDPAQIGGAIGGALDARDGALREAERQLDQLAWEFGNALNAVHRNGYALDGSTGGDLFVLGAGPSGAAAYISVDPSVRADPNRLAASSTLDGLPGNGENLLALIETESEPLPGGNDPIRTLGRIVGDFGARTARAEATAASDGAILENLRTMRESVSGVSIDEELVEMTRAQRAFEAVAKVIVTTDEMLETLLNLR